MSSTSQMADAYNAFRFAVKIGNDEVSFTECTLPALEVDVLEQKEGGYNHAVHLISGPVKAGRVTLKRGFATSKELLQWYFDVASGDRQKAERNISVIMFDSTGKEVLHLDFVKAYPVKWTGPAFKSSDSAIAIETLELAFAEFKPGK